MQTKKEKSITQRLRQSDIYDLPIKWEHFICQDHGGQVGNEGFNLITLADLPSDLNETREIPVIYINCSITKDHKALYLVFNIYRSTIWLYPELWEEGVLTAFDDCHLIDEEEDFHVATYGIHCGETFEDVCKTYKRLVSQYSLHDALETMYKIPAETED